MSGMYSRRGRNWFTAMGTMFLIMSMIIFARQLFIWGPDFVLDFLLNSEFTNEKVSTAMMVFGCIMITKGLLKNDSR